MGRLWEDFRRRCCRAFRTSQLQTFELRDGSILTTIKQRQPASALLFCFTGDAVSALTKDSTALIPRGLQTMGVLAASIDLPCHGLDHRPGEPERLAGWRFRIDNGESLMADFTRRCSEAIDLLTASGALTVGAPVCALGISRGAFAALHLAAAEPRVRYLLAMSPLVSLSRLPEFDGHAGVLSQQVPVSSVRAAEAWMGVRETDDTIHTQDTLALVDRLRSAGVNVHSTVVPGSGHNIGPVCHRLAGEWLGARLTGFR